MEMDALVLVRVFRSRRIDEGDEQMSFIIIARNPNTKKLIVVVGKDIPGPDKREIREWQTKDEAAEITTDQISVFKEWPHQIVEVEI